MIQLTTLGSLELSNVSGPLLAGRRKVLALLTYLARRSPESVTRAELTGLFWGTRDDTHAKQSLRQALAELRAPFGDALEADSESVRLVDGVLRPDFRVFDEAVAHERWDEAGALWRGDFLPDLEGLGTEPWVLWLGNQRDILRHQAARAFDALSAVSVRKSEWPVAADWAAKWCDVAPLDEQAIRRRIDALVHVGRPVDASVCYEGYVRRVKVQLGADPSPEFEALKQSFAADGLPSYRKARQGGNVTLSGLAQLSGDARTLVEAAAVVGAPASAALLRKLAELTSHAFSHAIDELVQGAILRPSEAVPGSYEFTSEANRKRVYDVTAAVRRRALHTALAGHLRVKASDEASKAVVEEHLRLGEKPKAFQIKRQFVFGVAAVPVLVVGVVLANWVAKVAKANDSALAAGSTILLADVRNETGELPMGEGLATAAVLSLQQSRHVALYPRKRARSLARSEQRKDGARNTGLDERAARQVAVREHVARIVSLDVRRVDSGYRLEARVIEPRTGAVLGEQQVEVRRPEVVDALDGLLKRVRSSLGESDASVRESSQPLRTMASSSLEALNAYAEGVEAWTEGDPDAARLAWTRALTIDSSFAMVALALANEAYDRSASGEGDAWMDRAIANEGRLLPTDVVRARQLRALRSGDLEAAARLALDVAQKTPSSEAWYGVGVVHVAARKCGDAIPAFGRALTLDSAHTRARLALAECELQQGNVKGALAAYATVQRLDSDALRRGSNSFPWGVALTRAGRFEEAKRAFSRLFASGSAMDSARGHEALASLESYRGRYAEAIPALENAARLYRRDGAARALYENLVTQATAFVAINGRTRASELIDEAYALGASAEREPAAYMELGHLMARMGRLNGARETLRLLSTRVVATRDEDAWAARVLTAGIRLAERNAPEALAAVEEGNAPASLDAFRLAVIADANAMAGQFDAALAAARRLAEGWHFGGAAQDEWMRATLRIARYSEALGDTASAKAAYKKFIDRWKDADVYLVDLAAAQRSLTRLGGNTVALNSR